VLARDEQGGDRPGHRPHVVGPPIDGSSERVDESDDTGDLNELIAAVARARLDEHRVLKHAPLLQLPDEVEVFEVAEEAAPRTRREQRTKEFGCLRREDGLAFFDRGEAGLGRPPDT